MFYISFIYVIGFFKQGVYPARVTVTTTAATVFEINRTDYDKVTLHTRMHNVPVLQNMSPGEIDDIIRYIIRKCTHTVYHIISY